MLHSIFRHVPGLVVMALTVLVPAQSFAQGQVIVQGKVVRLPRVHAALHELHEARRELAKTQDIWPSGYRDRALMAIDDAIRTVKTILAINADAPYGLNRNPDYFKRYPDMPHVRAALDDLRDARDELRPANIDPVLKERALLDIDIAIGSIASLVRRRS